MSGNKYMGPRELSLCSKRFFYDGSGNIEYIGYCKEGYDASTDTDQPCWCIEKLVYGASGITHDLFTKDQYGNFMFEDVLDDRATSPNFK